MCGLTGFISAAPDEELVVAFQRIAGLSVLRGAHSTGCLDFAPTLKPAIKYDKCTRTASEYFADYGRFDNTFFLQRYSDSKTWPNALVAHARQATIGKVNRENAHPFRHDHIIGVHNGSVYNGFKNKKKFETDSEAIFYNMAHEGEEAALKELENTYGAAYALIWLNGRDKSFNVVRNAERPLSFSISPDAKSIFFSSDRAFLEAVLPYYKFKQYPATVPEGTHFKYFLENDALRIEKTEVKRRFFSVVVKERGGGKSETPMKNGTGVNKLPNIPDANFYKVWSKNNEGRLTFNIDANTELTEAAYRQHLARGCAGCGVVLPLYEDAWFLPDCETFSCRACYKDADMRKMIRLDYLDNALKQHETPKKE